MIYTTVEYTKIGAAKKESSAQGKILFGKNTVCGMHTLEIKQNAVSDQPEKKFMIMEKKYTTAHWHYCRVARVQFFDCGLFFNSPKRVQPLLLKPVKRNSAAKA